MKVRVIATGGTIASFRDASGAVTATLAPEHILQQVSHQPGVEVTAESIARVNGWNITPALMLQIAAAVARANAEDDLAGTIILHGTDTIEETAFLIDLTSSSPKPVVFVGSLRYNDEVGTDGLRNLENALGVAKHPQSRGRGTLLVVNDEIHAARWVRKVDSFRPNAFESPGHSPVGLITPEGITFAPIQLPRVELSLPDVFTVPVALVETYAGMEEGLIETVLALSGAGGLVLDGTGLGNVPGSAMSGIQKALDQGALVVIASRVKSGGTAPLYGGPGGGRTLADLGVMSAGELTAAKARLLLMLLLSLNAPERAAKEFHSVIQILMNRHL